MIKIKIILSDLSSYMHTPEWSGFYSPEVCVCYFTVANIQNICIIHDSFNISVY